MPNKLAIVGGGPAATNAMETIRHFDSDATVTLISDEPMHSRMALPYWLSGKISREQTHTGDPEYFRKLNVDAKIGSRVKRLDASSQSLELTDGERIEFDQLLIATGSKPLPLPADGTDLPGVHHLWTLADTANVLSAAAAVSDAPRVAMIGAGFIGLIVLNAMHKCGWNLTVIERDDQILPRMLDRAAAAIAEEWLREQDVAVMTRQTVQAIEQTDSGAKRICLASGDQVEADVVIIATGVRPNLALVDETSIHHEHGILVDDQMRTNIPTIFAAGDVAQGPVRFSDLREVHAIQPTAVDHGRVAGANMAGGTVRYPGSLSMNVLDVCGLQCASFGRWDDSSAAAVKIENADDSIYRCLRWTGDQLTGAVFAGKANDMGMLTDVGMVKGLIQTGVHMGDWKSYLVENPFDIRRAFVAKKVPHLLMQETLLGRPAAARQYRYQNTAPRQQPGASHEAYVGTKNRTD